MKPYQSLAAPTRNQRLEMLGSVSENRGGGGGGGTSLSVKRVSGLAHSGSECKPRHKRDLKPSGVPLTAPFITACYLNLKGGFFINNFVDIIGGAPGG